MSEWLKIGTRQLNQLNWNIIENCRTSKNFQSKAELQGKSVESRLQFLGAVLNATKIDANRATRLLRNRHAITSHSRNIFLVCFDWKTLAVGRCLHSIHYRGFYRCTACDIVDFLFREKKISRKIRVMIQDGQL